MKAKLSIGLLATLGVSALLASALAQQPAPQPGHNLFARDTSGSGMSSQAGFPFGQNQNFGSAQLTFSDAERTLIHRADELAKKLGETKSETDRSQIKTELQELLEKQFGLRQKRHQEEIAALEAKVKKLKDLVEKRQENRREIIAKRLDQILSNAEGLGW